MMFSGILIRTGGGDAITRLRPLLAGEPRCTAGDASGGVLAAVLEFSDSSEARELHAWLEGLSGVEFVDVTGIQYEDGPQGPLTQGET